MSPGCHMEDAVPITHFLAGGSKVKTDLKNHLASPTPLFQSP